MSYFRFASIAFFATALVTSFQNCSPNGVAGGDDDVDPASCPNVSACLTPLASLTFNNGMTAIDPTTPASVNTPLLVPSIYSAALPVGFIEFGTAARDTTTTAANTTITSLQSPYRLDVTVSLGGIYFLDSHQNWEILSPTDSKYLKIQALRTALQNLSVTSSLKYAPSTGIASTGERLTYLALYMTDGTSLQFVSQADTSLTSANMDLFYRADTTYTSTLTSLFGYNLGGTSFQSLVK